MISRTLTSQNYINIALSMNPILHSQSRGPCNDPVSTSFNTTRQPTFWDYASINVRENQRMDNQVALATLVTQDTGRRQTKHKNTTQQTKHMRNTGPHYKSVMNPGVREG